MAGPVTNLRRVSKCLWSQVPFFERNYRVITLDLRGHGKSGSPVSGPLTMELFAKAIEAVRVEAKAGKMVLVGHSLETPVIRQYARLFPANVAAMVPVEESSIFPESLTLLIRIA
jgi:non-heme chloroperoxidase